MQLTDFEKSMLEGDHGRAKARAMDLLVRYGEALGAERLVETNNVAGAFNASTPSVKAIVDKGMDHVFSELNLDSDEVVEIPHMAANTCQLITGIDNDNWKLQGASEDLINMQRGAEKYLGARGVNMFATCTPYQVGNVPVKGEHCAWMESSAVIYCNSVLGARTNVEGKESTGAAGLTGRIPYWGYHITENRYGSHLVEVDVETDDMMDWGLLGYWLGEQVEENIPVLNGISHQPNLIKLKHFGAAAASSGGVEMYHIPGVTPEAASIEEAFGPKKSLATFRYGRAQRRETYEKIQSATERKVDFIMLGCPHNSIEQMALIAHMLTDKKVHPDVALWVHTPRALKQVADRNGYCDIITAAGGVVMSDTCPAISRRLPPGVRVMATDSAKQAHYLPAIAKVQGWFGSVNDCIDAAITGQWNGGIQ
ncbi:aconitase X catalytic domain-containing protein [Mariluticola halotolerans]|uniref:aconitase X catalytic domain-containing protein n=1 Tax=Mariluticola halotolerans TaxID=2909283 RepID=UPI0026E2938B|nr:aconitase X catalytic domain-containing protein [Mariluticola halotolerans]UJQ94648.1 aconitase X catalytic domain-containing protein [Mariluticola halotolerans]